MLPSLNKLVKKNSVYFWLSPDSLKIDGNAVSVTDQPIIGREEGVHGALRVDLHSAQKGNDDLPAMKCHSSSPHTTDSTK